MCVCALSAPAHLPGLCAWAPKQLSHPYLLLCCVLHDPLGGCQHRPEPKPQREPEPQRQGPLSLALRTRTHGNGCTVVVSGLDMSINLLTASQMATACPMAHGLGR